MKEKINKISQTKMVTSVAGDKKSFFFTIFGVVL